MPRPFLTEEEAKILFAQQINALAAEGPDPDCERRMAEIIAENEAECLQMERDLAAESYRLSQRSAMGN